MTVVPCEYKQKKRFFFSLRSLECTSYLLVLFKLLADDISHDPYFLHKSRFSFSFLFLSFSVALGPTWRSLSRGAHVDKDSHACTFVACCACKLISNLTV